MLSHFDDMELSTVCSEDGVGEVHQSRTGNRKFIPHDTSHMCALMCERISLLVDIPIVNAEKIQLLHYEDGENMTHTSMHLIRTRLNGSITRLVVSVL